MNNQLTIYAPIRLHTNGDEFVQATQASNLKSYVEHGISRDEKQVPEWCSKYPLVRIGTFECVEIREEDNVS